MGYTVNGAHKRLHYAAPPIVTPAEVERLGNALVQHALRVLGPDARAFGLAMRDNPYSTECRAFWQRLEADPEARPLVVQARALAAAEGGEL